MTNTSLTIALVPLDERPVNTRYPQMVADIAGAQVLLPPAEARGFLREPADLQQIAEWLNDVTSGPANVAIVSCDYLGYGNLINARITEDGVVDVLARLGLLAEVNRRCPVHAFALITRAPNADDCVEEPLYWAQWGTKFHKYARLAHQRECGVLAPGSDDERALTELENSLPPDIKANWLMRRLRNHTVSLALLDMAGRGQIASLLLTNDDTSEYGFPSRERNWLRAWRDLIGPALSDHVMMHPGADEVGTALVASLINAHHGRAPRVWIDYAIPADAALIAPYEDRPVRETLEGQIAACGCILAASADECDFILGVATPSPRRTDYRPDFLAGDRAERTPAYTDFLARLGARQQIGIPVALADVAYPNGSDPLFAELLLTPDSPLAPGSLAAYGAWNTAGNTLGVVVAQAACSLLTEGNPERLAAQNLFLTHRFLEDYGYQTVIRREARADATQRWGHQEPTANDDGEQVITCAFIEARLGEILLQLQTVGIGTGLCIQRGSVRLPWKRTFEVDFAFE